MAGHPLDREHVIRGIKKEEEHFAPQVLLTQVSARDAIIQKFLEGVHNGFAIANNQCGKRMSANNMDESFQFRSVGCLYWPIRGMECVVN